MKDPGVWRGPAVDPEPSSLRRIATQATTRSVVFEKYPTIHPTMAQSMDRINKSIQLVVV
jgi:hypothetical protein